MSNEGRRWTIYVCPECGCYESPESVARDHESGRSYCVNFDAHPLTDERSDWPPVERVEVVEAGGEREAKPNVTVPPNALENLLHAIEAVKSNLNPAADNDYRLLVRLEAVEREAALASGPPGGEE